MAYLRDREILSAAQIQRLERHRANKNESIGRALQDLSFLDEATFLSSWAAMMDSAVLSPGDLSPAEEALPLLPGGTCVRYGVLPLRKADGRLVVASSDPTNIIIMDELRFLTGLDILWMPASSKDLKSAIFMAYPDASGSDTTSDVEDSPVIKEVQRILDGALESGASHVHLEPSADAFTVLFRIEGTLREIRRLPKSFQAGISARLKILGELDIAERNLPQSGTIRLRESGRSADFIIATLPTAFYRERITLSVMDPAQPIPAPEGLGFTPELSSRLAQISRTRDGLLVVSGPGSSGRTTTLYSLAVSIAKLGRKVLTIEERVYRPMKEFTQVEPRAHTSYPISMALRHALHQDSEVLFLDPLGDAETLAMAISASARARLVIASLHARSLEGALERLGWMAPDPYLLASELRAILFQQLLRTLCPSCKEPEKISRDLATRYGLGTTSLAKPKGCPACRGLGFRGRVAVGGLLEVDGALRDWLHAQSTGEAAKRREIPSGAGALRRAVFSKVETGATSLEEALGQLDPLA
ncbi:MAG TPA: ATPase, T2SS/T4P/T4SS family [Planctomycetota bacterium]|nr:ATPase, T2SS/T4P/T4SS family [Planctomycetota bacterium]